MTTLCTEERPPTLLERMGGVSGLVYASVPSIAYAVVNAIASLTAAVVVAVGASAGLIVVRLLRKEPIQPAVSGLLGVVVAASIALCTGAAENYFLPGIWVSLLLAVAFALSIVVRRPLVGVVWNLLTSVDRGRQWRTDKVSRHAFDIATAVFAAVFASRFVVQQWLYDAGATGWLAFARIGVGFPLLAVALLVMYWAVRRAVGHSGGFRSGDESQSAGDPADPSGVIPDERQQPCARDAGNLGDEADGALDR
jgi:hypothetical protein